MGVLTVARRFFKEKERRGRESCCDLRAAAGVKLDKISLNSSNNSIVFMTGA